MGGKENSIPANFFSRLINDFAYGEKIELDRIFNGVPDFCKASFASRTI